MCTSTPSEDMCWINGYSLIFLHSFSWLVLFSFGRSCQNRYRIVDR